MPSQTPARHLQIADVLALQPGDRIIVHPVTDELIVTRNGRNAAPAAREMAHLSFAPPGSLRADNLEKILDCFLETRIVLREAGDTVLQVFRLESVNWGHLLKHEGADVDILVGGQKIARGKVVCDEIGAGLHVTGLWGRPRDMEKLG